MFFDKHPFSVVWLMTGIGFFPVTSVLAEDNNNQKTTLNNINVSNDFNDFYQPKTNQKIRYSQLVNRSSHCVGGWMLPNLDVNIANTQASNTNFESEIDRTTIEKTTSNEVIDEATADKERIIAQADHVYVSADNQVEMNGQVKVNQGDIKVASEQLKIDLTSKQVSANKRVKIIQNGFYTESESLELNLNDTKQDQNGTITKKDKTPSSNVVRNSRFFNTSNNGHGNAERIEKTNANRLQLTQVNYSTCPPKKISMQTDRTKTKEDAVLDWHINSKQLTIHNDTGRAVAKHAKLYAVGYPIFYLPYINFPIDDRRTTGFLTPKVGLSNNGGFYVATPFYFNMAPNYDLTMTPKYLSKRGLLLDSEFRLLSKLGNSKVNFGYIAHDDTSKQYNRKMVSAIHNWQYSPSLSFFGYYNYVSDKDYFTDFSTDPTFDDELNVPRGFSLNYEAQAHDLTADLKIETFQTVSKEVADKNKPYARLPQLTVDYHKHWENDLITDAKMDFGWFRKPIKDGSQIEDSGVRLYNRVDLAYPLSQPWGNLTPAIGLKHISTWFSKDNPNPSINNNDKTAVALQPQASLAGELEFESLDNPLNLKQIIKPEFYYVYSPYVSQKNIPNYDTVDSSFGYDSLFNNERFIGNGRLADTNALTLGVSYKVFDDNSLERFNIAIANRFNFDNQQMNLKGAQQKIDVSSGMVTRLQGYITPQLKLTSDFSLNNNKSNNRDSDKQNFNISTLSWQPQQHTILNVGYIERNLSVQKNQQPIQQSTASFMLPLNQNWQVYGHLQYDLSSKKSIDQLFGFNYESCCYRFAIYGRRFYNDFDNIHQDSPNQQIMGEITLKGLTNSTGDLSKILNRKILGYAQTKTAWKK